METQRWRAEDRDMKDGRDVKKMKMKIDKRWRCEGCSLRSLTSNCCEDMKMRRCEDTKIYAKIRRYGDQMEMNVMRYDG